MATRCKFECVKVSKRKGWGGPVFVYDAEFNVVHGNNPENKEFFASTPSGSVNISTLRDDTFKVGKEYYLDFLEAPEATA